jgi:hypothetical protein
MWLFLDQRGLDNLRKLSSFELVLFDTSALLNTPQLFFGCLNGGHRVAVVPDFIERQLRITSVDRRQKENRRAVLEKLRAPDGLIILRTDYKENSVRALGLVNDPHAKRMIMEASTRRKGDAHETGQEKSRVDTRDVALASIFWVMKRHGIRVFLETVDFKLKDLAGNLSRLLGAVG